MYLVITLCLSLGLILGDVNDTQNNLDTLTAIFNVRFNDGVLFPSEWD